MQALTSIGNYIWPKKEPETFTEHVSAVAEVIKQTPASTWMNPHQWAKIVEEHPRQVKFVCQAILVARIAMQIGNDPYGMILKMGCGAVVGGVAGTVFAKEWAQCAEKLNEGWSKTSKGFQITAGCLANVAINELSAPTITAMVAGIAATRAITNKQQ